jgi:hypothetical protein
MLGSLVINNMVGWGCDIISTTIRKFVGTTKTNNKMYKTNRTRYHNYGRALMSAPPQAIAPNSYTNWLNVHIQIAKLKWDFNNNKKHTHTLAHIGSTQYRLAQFPGIFVSHRNHWNAANYAEYSEWVIGALNDSKFIQCNTPSCL